MAVPVDGTGTASEAPVMAPPVPGVQKPPRQVGKWFLDHLVAAPEKKQVKRPAGLRTRPAWLWQDRLGASPAVCGVLVFQPRTERNALVSPIGVVIVKFTLAIARVLK